MVQSKSSWMDLDEAKPKPIEVDLEEKLQKEDLLGTADWDPADQQDACNLICDYACIISWNDLDLGKASIVKHSIKLNDPTPFKECYRCIPLGMYEEVKAHIQEILDIGVIHLSNSLWASAVVLV